MEDPDAPGTYGKNVTGSAATGNWVMYVKINPGAWINWHWHSNSQTLYAVGGTMEYEVRPHKTVKLIPGSYLVVPGHALHNGTCIGKEPCLFFIENLLPNDKHMTDASGNEVKRGKPARLAFRGAASVNIASPFKAEKREGPETTAEPHH